MRGIFYQSKYQILLWTTGGVIVSGYYPIFTDITQ